MTKMKLSRSEKERLRTNYGDWAVVAGASSGIGFEIAKQLASAGIHLILHARNAERLQEAMRQIKEHSEVEVRIVASDLSESEGINTLLQVCTNLTIGMVVISAGFGTSGLFRDSSLHVETNLLRVNCEALLTITHYFSNLFASRGRGGIILMSSMVAFQGTPYSANYAASKAYVQTLGEALAIELKPLGVGVLVAAPGPVASGFGRRANMNMSMSLLPSQVGIPIVRALGRQSTVLPGLLTKILVYSLRTVPRWVKIRIMEKVMGGMTQHQRS